MIRNVILSSMFLFFLSCREAPERIPLEEEQMVALLTDMHIAESILQSVPAVDRDSMGKIYYRIIFRTHDVSQRDFEESLDILREDPVRLEAVYTQVVEKLSTKEAENQAKASGNSHMPDSLNVQE